MLPIAKILKSDGTDGGLLISERGVDFFSDIDRKEPVFIEFDGLPVPFFIEDIRPKGSGKAVVHLTAILSLEDSEELVGRLILSPDSLSGEEPEELSFDGWTLLDKGRKVGVVSGVEPFPGNPCLTVDTPSGEVMVPLHEDLILSADPASRVLDLDIPEGLL